MSESPDPKTDKSAEDLASEFHHLGDNLKNFLSLMPGRVNSASHFNRKLNQV